MKRVLLVIAFLLIVATTACDSVSGLLDKPTPTKPPTPMPPTATIKPTVPPTATPIPTATVSPTSVNPLDALTRMFRGWGSVKSFRAKMTTTPAPAKTGTPVPPTEMTLEVVMPDRFHIMSKQFEAIKIGTIFYMKTGNQWIKASLPQGLDFSFADVKKLESQLGISTDTKFVGPEVLDGTPTLVYQFVTTIKTPVATMTTSKVWVAVSDGLPRKMESTGQTGSKTVAIYSDYNAAITIEAPIK